MDCVHHWKIETPNGARAGGCWSAGSCIRCGESRKFRNSLPEGDTYGGRLRDARSVRKPQRFVAPN